MGGRKDHSPPADDTILITGPGEQPFPDPAPGGDRLPGAERADRRSRSGKQALFLARHASA